MTKRASSSTASRARRPPSTRWRRRIASIGLTAWLLHVPSNAIADDALPLHTRALVTRNDSGEAERLRDAQSLAMLADFPWGRLTGTVIVLRLRDRTRLTARFSAFRNGVLYLVHPNKNRDNRILGVPIGLLQGIEFTPGVASLFERELQLVMDAQAEMVASSSGSPSSKSGSISPTDIASAYAHYRRQLVKVEQELATLRREMKQHPTTRFVGLAIAGGAVSLVVAGFLTQYTVMGHGCGDCDAGDRRRLDRLLYIGGGTLLLVASPTSIYSMVRWRQNKRALRPYHEKSRQLVEQQQRLRGLVQQLSPLAGADHIFVDGSVATAQ